MIKKLNDEQKNEAYVYIEVGLMYGYEDDRRLRTEFPSLYLYFENAQF